MLDTNALRLVGVQMASKLKNGPIPPSYLLSDFKARVEILSHFYTVKILTLFKPATYSKLVKAKKRWANTTSSPNASPTNQKSSI